MHLERVGGHTARASVPGALGRKEIAHQLPRTPSRVIGYKDLHKGQGLCTCEIANGQYSSCSIHKQNGGGTHSQVLSNLALDLWEWCIHNNVEVSAQHLPGHLNIRADRESRLLPDSNDWKLNPVMFQSLVMNWGPLEISSHSLSVGDRTP
jgi:hypothetical protein